MLTYEPALPCYTVNYSYKSGIITDLSIMTGKAKSRLYPPYPYYDLRDSR